MLASSNYKDRQQYKAFGGKVSEPFDQSHNGYFWLGAKKGRCPTQEPRPEEEIRSINSIELAKVWILATYGLKKTWNNGDVVEGGYPTCSRALSTAGMESANTGSAYNEYDGRFYGASSGCGDCLGGCWQTSNPDTSICRDTVNPFCTALQAWGHITGTNGISDDSCDSSNSDTNASSCTFEQLQAISGEKRSTGVNPEYGHDQGCHFGALCYGWGGAGWNSPLSGALFKICSNQDSTLNKTTWPTAASSNVCSAVASSNLVVPGTLPKYSCEIAQCACDIALDELRKDERYKKLDFTNKITDNGYTAFIKACKTGPLS